METDDKNLEDSTVDAEKAVQEELNKDAVGTDSDTVTEEEQGTQTETKEVTSDFNKEALLADLHKERGRRKELTEKVTELTEKVSGADQIKEEFTSLESKYNRLEEFLTLAGGPLSKAMDSRSFTNALFNTNDDVSKIVEKWHKENPSQTSSALAGGTGGGNPKPDMNALLRASLK